MSRIVCFSYERLFYPDNILSGPGLRLWEMASALKRKNHKVNIAELNHERDYTKEGINFISWDPISLRNIEKQYDSAIILLSAYVTKYFGEIKKIPTLVDLTTPIAIESQAHSLGKKSDFFLNEGIIPTFIALEKGDFFVCSNEAQKNFYIGMMSLMGISNLNQELIKIAYFAPKKEKPILENKRILEKIVGKNKKVLLWMGSMFSWYDYKTPILAMKEIAKEQKDAVLVFVGANNPNITALTKENYRKALSYAKSQKLINKNVFFIDWVNYEDRMNIYAEAKIAVVTSYDSAESALCYRTRIIDSFEARLPVICTDNDMLSKIIKEKNLGESVKVQDFEELSKKILIMLNNEKKLSAYSKRIDTFIKNEFNIDITIKPIDAFCKAPEKFSKKSKIDFLSLINEQEKRIKELEYIKNDKIATNKTLVEEITNFQLRYNNILKDKAESEQDLKNQINERKKESEDKKGLIENQLEIIEKQRKVIGEYRASIVYPFYKITHSFGNTQIGKIISKLIK